MLKKSILFSAVAGIVLATGCTNNVADTVVLGTIWTSEEDGQTVEAIAVKDGKYIYAGDRDGVAAFIKEGKTEVIDHSGKGMVMPSCTDGHSHFIMGEALKCMGGVMLKPGEGTDVFWERLKEQYDRTKQDGKTNLIGFGWSYHVFLDEGMPTREQIDAVCPDIAVYINDDEGHKGLANTLCLIKAGILDEEGNVLKSEIRGGKISMDSDGKPDGLLFEQAGTYVRFHGIDFNELLTPEVAEAAILNSQELLIANGYTNYMDGWSNYFVTDGFYKGVKSLDEKDLLNINVGYSYELESWCEDIDKELDTALEWSKKYASPHLHSDYIKLFIDGTVEGGTGFTIDEYPAGGHGIDNWTQEEVNDITAKANAKGLAMHVHTMGDAAVNRCVNAFEAYGKKECRNTLVHLRNVVPGDFQRIADNDIYCTVGILWHVLADEIREPLSAIIPEGCRNGSYPIKSHVELGTNVTSSCDYPATSGASINPFSIVETAVTGSTFYPPMGGHTTPWNPEELVTREQMLNILTINGSRQLKMENERGSVKAGKWADFILIDKNVLDCPEKELAATKVLATYFEGKKVYSLQ